MRMIEKLLLPLGVISLIALVLSGPQRGLAQTVSTEAAFEAALATPGEQPIVIELDPGFRYCKSVAITRPYVTIKTRGFVPSGRVPLAAKLATFCDDSTDAAINVLADGVALIGLRVETKAAKWNHILIGWWDGNAKHGGAPKAILLDSLIVTSEGPSIRGVAANGDGVVIRGSHIAGYRRAGNDSQAICLWDAKGPLRVENNYLAGAAENVMIGGAPPSDPTWVPSDIVVTGNHFVKDAKWTAEGAVVKNLFECKVCKDTLIEKNFFEWGTPPNGQAGFAFVMTPRWEGGKAPMAVVKNVIIRDNVVHGSPGGLNFQVGDNYDPNRLQRVDNVLVERNYFTKWQTLKGMGRALQFTEYQPFKIEVVDNWFDNGPYAAGTESAVLVKDGGMVWPGEGTLRGNWMDHGAYGIMATSPKAFMAEAAGRVSGNVFTNWYNAEKWAEAAPGNVWSGVPLTPEQEPPLAAKQAWAKIVADAKSGLAVSAPVVPVVDEPPPAVSPFVATVLVTVPATGATCEVRLVAPTPVPPKAAKVPYKAKSRRSGKK